VKRTLLTLGACAGLAAGCGNDTSRQPTGGGARPAQSVASTGETAPADPRPTAGRPHGPLVRLRNSQFGRVLFDGRSRALYLFTRDARRKPRCYGDCAQAWPPFYAKGRPRAGRGVQGSLLGTIGRRDGRRQVTYKGQPLYFYVRDPKGQVLCNHVVEFGGTWFALNAAGKPPA
jgi:predicted lipoprotein with Yx(FWY)xxD motif